MSEKLDQIQPLEQDPERWGDKPPLPLLVRTDNGAVIVALQKELEQVKAERDAARGAFLGYGAHWGTCDYNQGDECICGFRDAYERVKK